MMGYRSFVPAFSALAATAIAFGCSAPGSSPIGDSTGGTTPAGGAVASGGHVHELGGSPGSGGSLTSGGAPGSGGSVAPTSGGLATTGGGSAGGAFGAGGSSISSGGSPVLGGASSGGASSTGGSGGVSGSSANGGRGGTTLTGGNSQGGSGASAGSATGGTSASGGSGGTTATGGGACTPPAVGAKGKNPLFTDQYTADPAPLVSGCKFYITCGHDEGQTGFVMREWFLLSSSDMVNWTKKVAMNLSVFSWADANAWAGQMVAKGGKFYWYVPVNKRGSGMAIGVAVGDSPDGPFKDAIGKPLVDDAVEMANWNFSDPGQTPFTIDPSVFVDDDGQAYLHYGGFSRMVVAKLNADMISLNGKMSESTPPGFFEAAYLIKRGGKYYEIYASGINPAAIDYATSNSPMGPWTRGGRVLDPLPNVAGQDAATNHAGVAEFGGQWYLVYHLSNGPNSGGTYKREVAVEKLTFNADGSIQKVTPSSGMNF